MGRSFFVVLVLPIVWACAPSAAPAHSTPAAAVAERAGEQKVIEHLAPRRDSVGPTPKRFSWSAIEGADSYSVGIWNDVDVLVWKGDNLKATSVEWPADAKLEPGTYFWMIAAYQQDRPIAESGRSAFVVTDASAR